MSEPACLEAALKYHALGWSVIPLCPPDHAGVGRAHQGMCKNRGKVPFVPNVPESRQMLWKHFQEARATAAEVESWYRFHPHLNLGVALGPVSRLVGIDVDTEDGEELLSVIADGDLPPTLEYRTGKGRRLLYRLPDGVKAESTPFTRLGTNVEILRLMAGGSQVVLPPSRHPAGGVYAWVPGRGPGEIEPADVPAWFVGQKRSASAKASRPAEGELIAAGGRNNYLISVAGTMRKVGMSGDAILAGLRVVNEERCDPPLSESEVETVARSASRYEPDAFVGITVKVGGKSSGDEAEKPTETLTEADVTKISDLKAAGAAIDWVWKGWIQKGVLVVFAAEGGTGKTRETADIVRRVSHNLPWPDGTPTTPWPNECVALWVVADNHHGEMVTLTEAFGIDKRVRVNSHPKDLYGGVTLETAEDLVMLEKRIELVKPLFVVIDTVGNSTDKNLSRQEDAKAYYQPLQIIARRQNVVMLCLTHLNAGGKILGRRVLEKVRVAWRMSAETVQDHTCRRRLEVIKSNSPYPPPLGVTMSDGGNEYDNDPPAAPEDREEGAPSGKKLGECVKLIEEAIAAAPVPISDLRKDLEDAGISAPTMYAAIKKLGAVQIKSGNRTWVCKDGDEPPKPTRIKGVE